MVTVQKGEYPYLDPGLESDIPAKRLVYRAKSYEPFRYYKKFTNKKSDELLPTGLLTLKRHNYQEKIASWLRANIFIPDARIGWIPRAISLSLRIVREHGVDLVFTSSPPHSTQLIGLFLKHRFHLPWVADLRDPWTGIRYYEFIKRNFYASRFDFFIEKSILRNADEIVTVSQSLLEEFQVKSEDTRREKFHVIPNGYDESDFKDNSYHKSSSFNIVYAGNLLDHQNPLVLWKCLADSAALRKNVKIYLIGRVHPVVLDSIDHHGLSGFTEIHGFIPHGEVVKYLSAADLLLMVIPKIHNNRGIVTGKLFEYIGSGRPILAFGPLQSDAGQILAQFSNSLMCDYDDIWNCRSFIEKTYESWLNGRLSVSSPELRRQFSRRSQAQKFVEIFDSLKSRDGK